MIHNGKLFDLKPKSHVGERLLENRTLRW